MVEIGAKLHLDFLRKHPVDVGFLVPTGSTGRKPHLRKGMIYGLQFPWTEEMLLSPKFGAEWLTQAMHVAGTLPKEGWLVFKGGWWSWELGSWGNIAQMLFPKTHVRIHVVYIYLHL